MGQQSLIYSFVARGTVILAEFTEFSGNFTGIAAQCLQKLPASNNKFTYNCDNHTFNYLVEDGFTYCVVAVESVGRQVPIAFLERVKEDFKKRYGGGKAATAVANSLNKDFGPKLKEHMQYCVDHAEEVGKLAKVKAQVSEVKGVMMENIEKVLERGEKIELLVDKTENLRSQAQDFRRHAHHRFSLQHHHLVMAGNLPFPPTIAFVAISLLLLCPLSLAWRPWQHDTTVSTTATSKLDDPTTLSASKRFEGSSDLVKLRYHMGPVLTNFINVHLIWYGNWPRASQQIIRDFILSLTPDQTALTKTPESVSTVAKWWRTVQLYTDQTGANVSGTVRISGEYRDPLYSLGKSLTRLSVQSVIKNAVTAQRGALPIDPKNGIYLVLTAPDVQMQDFCRAVCGFHYFTFPSIVGYTLPYAWVGNSATQCPGTCAFPFALPAYMSGKTTALRPPNGDLAVDGMISVIGHEIAELSSNPLINAWYAGEDPTAPTEIADLCEGLYGTGGGGSYIGQVMTDGRGHQYNMVGKGGRRFLVQWLWSPVVNSCVGPNALD